MGGARETALDLLGQEGGAALEIASLLAFLASEPVAVATLEEGWGPAGLKNAGGLGDAIETLVGESLVERHGTRVQLSRATGIALRRRLDDASKKHWTKSALRLLRGTFPHETDDVRTWERCGALLPHLLAATSHAISLEILDSDGLWLLDGAATFEHSRGRAAEADELVQRALTRAPRILTGDDPLTGTLHSTAGDVFRARGDFEAALREYERALAVHRAALPPGDPRILIGVANLVLIRAELGWGGLAAKDLEEALKAREDQPLNRADVGGWSILGWTRLPQPEHEHGRPAYERALALSEELVGPDHPDTASARGGLGLCLEQLGELKEAKRELESAIEITRASFGDGHPEVAILRSNLASVLQDLSDLPGARRQLEAALEDRGGSTPSPHGRWIRHRKLASVLLLLPDLPAAQDHALRALELSRELVGADDPRIAQDLLSLAEVELALGKPNDAVESRREALAIIEAKFGDKHLETAGYAMVLGKALAAAGADGAALVPYERALRIYVAANGENHRTSSVARINLATAMRRLGEATARSLSGLGRENGATRVREQAIGYFVAQLREELGRGDASSLLTVAEAARDIDRELAWTALERAESSQDPDSSGLQEASSQRRLGTAWLNLGRVCRRHGEDERAIAAIERSATQFASYPQYQGISFHEIGDLHRRGKDKEGAVEYYERAAACKRESIAAGRSPQTLSGTLIQLGRALASTGRLEDALAALRERLEILTGLVEPSPQNEGVTLHDIGDVQMQQGKLDDAIVSYRAAAERKREARDSEGKPRDLATTLLALGRALADKREFNEALTVLSERLEVLRTVPDLDPAVEGATLHEVADLHYVTDRPQEAIRFYRQACERQRRALEDGGDPGQLALTLHGLGRTQERLDELDAALASHEERLEILEAFPTRDVRAEGDAIADIGEILRRKGKREEALACFERAVERKRAAAERGEGSRDLALNLLDLGRASLAVGKLDEALAAHEERLSILVAQERREPQAEGVTLHDIGDVRREEGEMAQAVELYEKAIDLKREAQDSGGTAKDLSVSMLALARTLESLEHLDEALDVYQEQLEILRTLGSRDVNAEGVCLHDIADVLAQKGETAQAAELYEQAAELKRKGNAPPSDVAASLLSLSAAEFELDTNSPKVVATAREAVGLLDEERDAAEIASGLVLIGEVALAEGNPEQALPALVRCNELLNDADVSILDVAAARSLLAIAHSELGDKESAAAARGDALALLQEAFDEGSMTTDWGTLVATLILCLDNGALDVAEALIAETRALTEREPTEVGRRRLAELLLYYGREQAVNQEDPDAAFAAYDERLGLLASLAEPDPLAEGVTLHDIADVRRGQKKLGEAAEFYRRAAERKSSAGDELSLALTLCQLGSVELEIEGLGAAQHADEALELLRGLPEASADQIAAALRLRAEVALGDDEPPRAVSLLEELEALDAKHGREAAARAETRELLATARAKLESG